MHSRAPVRGGGALLTTTTLSEGSYLKAALDGRWRCCRPLRTSAIVARVVILSAKKMIHFRLENRTIFVRKISTRTALHHTRDHSAHIFRVSIEVCLYFSTHKIIYLYFNIAKQLIGAANTRHLQYIYHGLFHERSSLVQKSGIFFFSGGGEVGDTLSVLRRV